LKRVLLIFSLIYCTSYFVQAQFSIGLQGGSNLSKMDFTNNQEYRYTEIDNHQGFIGGIVLQFLGEKHAGVQAEFNYSQRGWVENDTTGIEYLKHKNKMDYLEMPIISHINIGGGKLRGVFNIGPLSGLCHKQKHHNRECGILVHPKLHNIHLIVKETISLISGCLLVQGWNIE
jgi:hypothetical protein